MQRRTNPRTGAWIQLAKDGDDMVLERVMKPHTGRADAHRHMDYVESFEILEGTATIVLDGQTISAGQGERIEIPGGTRSQSFLAGLPIALQKPVIAIGALVARLRGYKPSY